MKTRFFAAIQQKQNNHKINAHSLKLCFANFVSVFVVVVAVVRVAFYSLFALLHARRTAIDAVIWLAVAQK